LYIALVLKLEKAYSFPLGAFDNTDYVEINEEMSKLCPLKMKRVICKN
jgi:hypothetical protein